jgi:hypothetical protein
LYIQITQAAHFSRIFGFPSDSSGPGLAVGKRLRKPSYRGHILAEVGESCSHTTRLDYLTGMPATPYWACRYGRRSSLFDDDDKAAAEQLRSSVVAPAQRSTAAQQKVQKVHSRRTQDDLPVHSFQTLLRDLATIVNNRVQPKNAATPAFDIITTPTALQQRALDVLRVPLKPLGV